MNIILWALAITGAIGTVQSAMHRIAVSNAIDKSFEALHKYAKQKQKRKPKKLKIYGKTYKRREPKR